MASIPACHAGDRGLIPRRGDRNYPIVCSPLPETAVATGQEVVETPEYAGQIKEEFNGDHSRTNFKT